MILASIDPSSTRTGYAILEVQGPAKPRIIDAGFLTGKEAGAKARPVARVLEMAKALADLLTEHQPDTIIIEIPDGPQYTRQKQRAASLATWAFAAGALWCAADAWSRRHDSPFYRTVAIGTAWTRGTSKADRKAAAKARYPGYRDAPDPGGDIADALCMADYWLAKSRKEQTP